MHQLNNNHLILQYNKSNKFGDLLEISFEIKEKGVVDYHAEVTENLLATPHAVHGGLIATLCDGALGIAALSCVVEENQVVATVEMNVKYLKAAFLGDKLTAKAEIIKAGRRLIFSEAKVYNQKNELIASASGTFNAYPAEKAGY